MWIFDCLIWFFRIVCKYFGHVVIYRVDGKLYCSRCWDGNLKETKLELTKRDKFF